MKRHEDEQEAIAPTSSVTSEPMRTPNRRARGKERQSHEEGERYEKATALNTVQLCAATAKARYSSSCRSDQSGSIQETALIYNQQNREAPGQLVVAPHFKYCWKCSGRNQPTRSYAVHNLLALLTSILQACCASVFRNSLFTFRALTRASKMRRLLHRYVAQDSLSVAARLSSAGLSKSRSGSLLRSNICPFQSAFRALALFPRVSRGGQ